MREQYYLAIEYILVRENLSMMRDPVKVLLGNLSISNLLCAVFVQLISAILGGYAISINNYQVKTKKVCFAPKAITISRTMDFWGWHINIQQQLVNMQRTSTT